MPDTLRARARRRAGRWLDGWWAALGRCVRRQWWNFGDALTALAESDADRCRQVIDADQQLDDMQKQIFQWVQDEIPRHVEATRAVINILSVARRLERIGDLSTNIAEHLIFLIERSPVRHVP